MRFKRIVLILFILVFIVTSCQRYPENNHRLQWWLTDIGWDEGNRIRSINGEGVVIAVIDTGIDATHPDLEGRIIEEYRVDGIGYAVNYEHGTAVAGIICAKPSNKEGVLGVATGAKIISIDISDEETTDVKKLIEGIEYAVSKNVDIINISAGIAEDNPELKAAIDRAYEEGIIIVAASGNDINGEILYPAQYEHVLSVNSYAPDGQRPFGSDAKSVYLPGGDIVTTHSSIYVPRKYISYTGTSVSSPILTGVIALVLQQTPNITNEDIYGYFTDYSREFKVNTILSDFREINNTKLR